MKILVFLLMLQFGFSQNQIQATLENVKEKTDYFLSESIYLKFSIINPTEKLLEFKTKYLPKYFVLKEEGENEYSLNLSISFSGESHIRIFPNDSLVTYWDLATLFSQGHKVEGLEHGLPIGDYVVYYRYTNDILHLESNHLKFRVIPPPKTEEKAFHLYSKAREMFWNTKKQKISPLEKMRASLDVVEKYPQSVYAPSALYLTQITAGTDNESLGMRLIKEYPTAQEVWNMLTIKINKFRPQKDKIGTEDFLRTVISDVPGTFAAKAAHIRLEKLKSLTLAEWLNSNLVTERKLKEYYELQK